MSKLGIVIREVEAEFPRLATAVVSVVDGVTGAHFTRSGAVDWAALSVAVVSYLASKHTWGAN